MAKKGIEDQRFELIKAHIVDPENTPLSEFDADKLDRILNMARILDRYPIDKNAVAIHMQKYKHIKLRQAYEDASMAKRLYNTLHKFEYDFWHAWAVNDIVKNIERWRKNPDPAAGRVIAMEHANLIKILGERPVKDIDPKLVEEHKFIIPIQINQTVHNFDLEKFLNLPETLRKKVTDALINDISDDEAKEIMES